MLTPENLAKLQKLVELHGGDEKAPLSAALEDLQKAIAGEALLIRNLLIELRNQQVSNAAMQNVMTQARLEGVFLALGSPKKNPFTVAEADAAVRELNTQIANATNFADILATVVKVAKVFV